MMFLSDGHHEEAPGESPAIELDADEGGINTRTALRRAAATALVGFALLFVVEMGRIAPEALPLQGLRYAVAAFACLLVFAVAHRTRHADRLGFILASVCALNLSASVLVWRTDPGVPAGALVCLLAGSVVLFGWSVVRMVALSAVAVSSFAAMATLAVGGGAATDALAAAGIVLAVGIVNALVGAELLASMRARIARRHRELATLSARLMEAQEEERRRMSRELHDEIGQSLTAALAYLWCIDRECPAGSADVRGHVGQTRQLLSQSLGAMRDLSQLLRPPALDQFGLLPSLESYVQRFGELHGVAASLAADGVPARLSPALETALYRIVQEALTNVARHAQARSVRVALAAHDGHLRLEVRDDGVGLGAAGVSGGVGLIGVRERVRALGGAISVRSGRGFCLSVRVPLSG